MSAGRPSRVQTSYTVVPKTMPYTVSTGVKRECAIATVTRIPFDYVPPPENVELRNIPTNWPADEEWSRDPSWGYYGQR